MKKKPTANKQQKKAFSANDYAIMERTGGKKSFNSFPWNDISCFILLSLLEIMGNSKDKIMNNCRKL